MALSHPPQFAPPHPGPNFVHTVGAQSPGGHAMNWQDHITSDTAILGGKPIIKGTRLSVEHIQGRLADGWTNEMLLESFPTLRAEHIQAVHAFVLECMVDGMLMWPLPGKAE